MDITLLVPPPMDTRGAVERVFGCSFELYPIPNIFLLTAAAVLERSGHRVIYKDFSSSRKNKKEWEAFLHEDKSDAYVIYSVFLSQAGDILALGDIRRIRSAVAVIFVGPAPTFDPEKFLKDENVYAARGEFDLSLTSLIQKCKEKNFFGMAGLSYRAGSRVVHHEPGELLGDLDLLPFASRHLLDKAAFVSPKFGMKTFTTMATSRGCQGRCIYCVPNSLSLAREFEARKKTGCKPPVACRSAQNVIEEFRLIQTQGYGAVSIVDDQFVLSEERTLRICAGLRGLKIDWGCASRADRLNETIIAQMAAAGCRYVDIGIESFYQDDLDYMQKDLDVDAIYKAVGLLKKHGVRAKANMLLGCSSGPTKERIRHNQGIVKKLGMDQVMYNICAPYPGTAFYQRAQKNKWLVYGEYRPCDVQKEAIVSYPSLSKAELEALAREGNRGFFLSPRYIISVLLKIKSLRQALLYCKVAMKKLGR